jgi:flagellin-like hook-associated protein FlgL
MGVGGFYPKYSYSISTSESGNTSDGVVSLSLINLSHIIEIGVPDKRYDYIWDQDNDGIVATNGSFNYSLTLGNIDYDTKSDNLLAPNGNQAGGITEDEGFLYSIMAVSMAQITYCIEKLSDEQARLVLSEELLTQNQVNLESAHGRIMDADIAPVSSRFAKQNVLVQSSAAMVAQVNQLTNVALQILG